MRLPLTRTQHSQSGFWLQCFWGHPQKGTLENSGGRKGSCVWVCISPGGRLDMSE